MGNKIEFLVILLSKFTIRVSRPTEWLTLKEELEFNLEFL